MWTPAQLPIESLELRELRTFFLGRKALIRENPRRRRRHANRLLLLLAPTDYYTTMYYARTRAENFLPASSLPACLPSVDTRIPIYPQQHH